VNIEAFSTASKESFTNTVYAFVFLIQLFYLSVLSIFYFAHCEVQRFYEGLASPITGYAFSSAVVFFSYGRALTMLGSNTLGDPSTLQASIAGGGI
jgi:hypothetical protein